MSATSAFCGNQFLNVHRQHTKALYGGQFGALTRLFTHYLQIFSCFTLGVEDILITDKVCHNSSFHLCWPLVPFTCTFTGYAELASGQANFQRGTLAVKTICITF
ncbi:hypothetical protein MRX96_003475 [Rhipicephalus microplus]